MIGKRVRYLTVDCLACVGRGPDRLFAFRSALARVVGRRRNVVA